MKSILVSLLLATSAFLFYGCERSDATVEKPLKIKMLNDKPCFYIDKFDGMDKFNIQSISVESSWGDPKVSTRTLWREGYYVRASNFHEDLHRPIGNAFLFPPSVVVGSDKCVEYGKHIIGQISIEKEIADSNYTDSDRMALYTDLNADIAPSDIGVLSPVVAKKLKKDIVYSASMIGWNKDQWASTKKMVGDVYFHVMFYLHKNTQTGNLEAVVVNDTNQTIK